MNDAETRAAAVKALEEATVAAIKAWKEATEPACQVWNAAYESIRQAWNEAKAPFDKVCREVTAAADKDRDEAIKVWKKAYDAAWKTWEESLAPARKVRDEAGVAADEVWARATAAATKIKKEACAAARKAWLEQGTEPYASGLPRQAHEGEIEMIDEPADLKAAFREAEEQRQDRIATNPNNGRTGWWRVTGMRHSAIAKASSAREAIEKALKSGLIGDWEEPEATFWKEELPDVFS